MNEKRVDKTENKENAKWKDKLIEKLKQFVKSRWFPLVAVSVVMLVVVVAGFLFGFRITSAPELENSWEAISAVASWVGIIVSVASAVASFMAVWCAIQVPKKIADRLDKIALFEKRYESFSFFEECVMLYKKSLDNSKKDVIVEQCYHMLEVENPKDIKQYDYHNKMKHFEYLLHQMEFLFPRIQENDLSGLYNALVSYIAAVLSENEIEKNKQNYINTMRKFGKYTDEIWDSMTISNIK